jgi:hypothetical protein
MAKSAEHISFGDNVETKIAKNMEWSLLPNKGIHSVLAPSQYSANFISFTKFPELLGKIQKMKKVNRQLKELKEKFNSHSLRTIKEEIAPLLLSITRSSLEKGKDGIEEVSKLFHRYKINTLLFKENILDLQPSASILNKWEKTPTSIKTQLTKKMNEQNKSNFTKKKKTTGKIYLQS